MPSAASRIDGGTPFRAARDAMMMVGRVEKREHEGADERRRARHAEEPDEHGQAQQTEHDRRDRGEVVDVHLDDVRPAVLQRVLLEVDRRRDADGERQQQRQRQREERAHHRAPYARLLRLTRVAVAEERTVEAQLQRIRLLQRSSIQRSWFSVNLPPSTDCAAMWPFMQHVHVVAREQPLRSRADR